MTEPSPFPPRPLPPSHAHSFSGYTSISEGHRHYMIGFTYPVNGGNQDNHVHHYQGFTIKAAGHAHRFYGTTGPPIPLPGGSHYHLIAGETYRNYLNPATYTKSGVTYSGGVQYNPEAKATHKHSYAGETGPGIGYDNL